MPRLPSFASLAAALLLAACQPNAAENAEEGAQGSLPAPRIVWAEQVKSSQGLDLSSFTGTIEARIDQPLAFRVGGKLAERLVDVGDRVSRGDVVARLDANDYSHALRAAAAEMRAAEAEAERTAADLERASELREKGHASQAGFEAAKAAASAASEALEAARERRALAENELAYAELKADADGVVTAVSAEPGQVVAAGQSIVALARDGDREAEIAIPESRLAGLKGAKAHVTLWALPGEEFDASLRELAPGADPAARTFRARFRIDDPKKLAKLGMTATVHLSREAVNSAVVVPLSAVWYRGEAANVWRANASRDGVEAVPVTLQRMEETYALVEGALRPGDLVVSMGAHRLDEKLAVQIEERAAETTGLRVGVVR
ncbi:efflux RND transporter periplasmic adaptor subunit [Stappia sp. F7233]|uniref:Efflux RND transporter periplasmic adaptor subunit n=1 Tax=Stappia albiluteola TaxID=2758565 RepID=A0A839ADH6_9HYPH|nr:efflux RND transporter periplasmic adaptor subunit [Stappia albiluteola]MBA5777733.1 efflux RND transporter periplasmic adaptor subunit [Stappia albiluteola]